MKYNREINEEKINQAKSRSISYVLDNIEKQNNKTSIFTQVRFKFVLSVMSFLLMLVIGLALFISPNGTNPITRPNLIELSQTDQKKLAEASYLTTGIISNALSSSINQLSFQRLTSKFSDKSEEFDYYLQMLKPLMEEEINDFELIILEDDIYDYRMIYQIDNQSYTFDLSTIDDKIQGVMTINNQEFLLDGEIEIENDSISIELNARSGADYIKIEYESEVEKDETEKEYEIKEFIKGLYKERQIEISRQGNELELEMTEIYNNQENSYQLTRVSSQSQVTYELEYEIDGVEGQGTISEEIVNGNIVYRYHIEENDFEEDYEFDDDDDDEDDDEDDE